MKAINTEQLTKFYGKNRGITDVNLSVEMLNMAKERFCDATNFDYANDNYNESLPKSDFDVIISALSIHHLDDAEKQSLFKRIFDKLPKGGVFVNYDMFNADTKEMTEKYNQYWENLVLNSQLPTADIEHWQKGRSIDRECSVSEEIAMLKSADFENVNCLYANLKFGVVMAKK